jgi:hypothetical protein
MIRPGKVESLEVNPSRISRAEITAVVAGFILVLSLFLPWYSLGSGPDIARGQEPAAWACGIGDNSCTGFETFQTLRWFWIVVGLAPLVLTFLAVRGVETSWPRGEMTAIIGLIAFVLIFFNGLIDRPSGRDIQIGLTWGYFVALFSSFTVFAAGAWGSLDHGGGAPRRPPGSFG